MNETTYDQEGNVIAYKYFRENDEGQVVVDESGELRLPTVEELEIYEMEQAELVKAQEKQEAKAFIELAKQSDNPDIANLADAFSKLLGE